MSPSFPLDDSITMTWVTGTFINFPFPATCHEMSHRRRKAKSFHFLVHNVHSTQTKIHFLAILKKRVPHQPLDYLSQANETLASIKFISFNECQAMFGLGVRVCVSSQKHSFWSTSEEKQPRILLKSKAFTTKGMHPCKSTFPIIRMLVLWEFAFNFGYTQNLTYC